MSRILTVLFALVALCVPSVAYAHAADPVYFRTAAKRLDTPWGVAFLPSGAALVAERNTGRIYSIKSGRKRLVGTLRSTYAQGEGGLLGLAVSPTFDTDRRVFAYVTTRADNRIYAMDLRHGSLVNRHAILTGIPRAGIHNGGRLAFGPDGFLYATPGDAGDGTRSQDPNSLAGKILRITPTGAAAPGNPTPGSPVWSLGHRDVQGITWDDQGRMWASEFGQNSLDELNLITPGSNYGWPFCEGPCEVPDARYTDPIRTWSTDVASPSGIAFLHGNLWMAALRGQRLWRIPVAADGSTGAPEAFLVGRYGRLRTVLATPSGNLWVTTSNRDGRGDPRTGDDRILSFRLP